MRSGSPALELPDFMVKCTFTNAESTRGGVDEFDSLLDVN